MNGDSSGTPCGPRVGPCGAARRAASRRGRTRRMRPLPRRCCCCCCCCWQTERKRSAVRYMLGVRNVWRGRLQDCSTHLRQLLRKQRVRLAQHPDLLLVPQQLLEPLPHRRHLGARLPAPGTSEARGQGAVGRVGRPQHRRHSDRDSRAGATDHALALLRTQRWQRAITTTATTIPRVGPGAQERCTACHCPPAAAWRPLTCAAALQAPPAAAAVLSSFRP